MSLARRVEPEWLDELQSDDPRALQSRRDLQRLNSLMFHTSMVARILNARPVFGRTRSILDIGGGDGMFTLAVARKLAQRSHGVVLTLVDRHVAVSDETCRNFDALGWKIAPIEADVFEFLNQANPASVDMVIANLFLHHFREAELGHLFCSAARLAPLFVAFEPRRAWIPMLASRFLWAIGCNRVTRHDAPVSVRAGFRGRELSMLWPSGGRWQLDECRAGPFSHTFVARHVP
jgi:hypothetical protein